MADIKSSEERSQNMARIHSKDTKPEVWFRKQLFKYGYRYRKHINSLPGHPDLWLSKYNTAIFVHGCFWHHHNGCKFAYMPKSRVDFWQKKFKNNIMRDQNVRQALEIKNIKQLIIWECTIKQMIRSVEYERVILRDVINFLTSKETYLEL